MELDSFTNYGNIYALFESLWMPPSWSVCKCCVPSTFHREFYGKKNLFILNEIS